MPSSPVSAWKKCAKGGMGSGLADPLSLELILFCATEREREREREKERDWLETRSLVFSIWPAF